MPSSSRKNYSSPDSQERHCVSEMEKLVTQFGYGNCFDALHKIGLRPSRPPKTRGRNAEFNYSKLMEIWLFVEEGRARKSLSVHAFCKDAEFSWFTSGLPEDHPEFKSPISKVIKSQTLRRRYNEAVALLKSDAELRRSGSERRNAFPPQTLEEIWQEELQRRLSDVAA